MCIRDSLEPLDIGIVIELSMGCGAGAVSYTHLDVYKRQIQIWPRGSQGWYAVDIFAYDDDGTEYCYLGQTPSLMEATKALSYWISLQWSIEMLHAACPWISKDPFHHEGSRISFE